MAEDSTPGHIFLCYARENRTELDVMADWLRQHGHAVWFDARIHAGLEWADELAEALDVCSLLVFLATSHSIESRYCRNEIAYAISLRQ